MTPRFDDLVVNQWGARLRGRQFSCSIGKGGIGKKRGEGDNVTPIGSHSMLGGFWRPDRIRPPSTVLELTPIGPQMIWSDDTEDARYNQLCRRPTSFSHERLQRADPLYDLVLTTDFNTDPVRPGMGSAIFLHVWRRPRAPTAGCVAFAVADLLWVASVWSPRSRLIIQG